MNLTKYIFIAFLVLLQACSSLGVDKIATYEHEYPDNNYSIVITGRKVLMAHDPISAVVKNSYKSECFIKVNRINGTVDASDLQIIQLDDFGSSKKVTLLKDVTGKIIFEANTLNIELYVSDALSSKGISKAYEFNGSFSLIHAGSK